MHMEIYRNRTRKPADQFAQHLKTVAEKYGFLVHNEDKMDMAHTFGSHGVEIGEGFDLHMIQICKPDKAARSLQANPERAVLMPKFVMTFSSGDQTAIRFLHYGREAISGLVDDDAFPASLEQSYTKIKEIIEEAIAL